MMKSSAVPPLLSTVGDSQPPAGPTLPISVRSAVSSRRLSGSGETLGGQFKHTAPSKSVSTRSVSESYSNIKLKGESVEGNLQIVNVIENTSEVMCVRYSPDGNVLAVGSADGSIKVYSSESGQCLYAMNCDDMTAVKLPVTNIRFCPTTMNDDRVEHSHMLAASYASGHVRFWHYSSGTCLNTTDDQRSQTMSLAFSSPGNKYATVGSDPQVFVYDVETKKRVCTLDATDSRDRMDGHRARVFAVVYHPTEPHVLLSGGWDDTVQYWDERQRHAFRKFYGPHICGDALDIDPVYSHILTGSWRKDCPLQIWDFGTGEKIKDVPQDVQNGSQLYCAQWVGRDSIACGGCLSNTARVIDRGTLNTVSQLINLPQGVYCLDNDRQGAKPKLAVGASMKVYQLKPLTSSYAVGGSK